MQAGTRGDWLSDLVVELADLLIFGRPNSDCVVVYHIPAVEAALSVTPGRWCLACMSCVAQYNDTEMVQVCTRKDQAGHESAQSACHTFSAALKEQVVALNSNMGVRGPRAADGSPVNIPAGSLLHMGPPPVPSAPDDQLAVAPPQSSLGYHATSLGSFARSFGSSGCCRCTVDWHQIQPRCRRVGFSEWIILVPKGSRPPPPFPVSSAERTRKSLTRFASQ